MYRKCERERRDHERDRGGKISPLMSVHWLVPRTFTERI